MVKKVEEELEELKKYKNVVNFSNDAIVLLDKLGRFTFLNKRTLEMTGYKKEELIGKHFKKLVPSKYLPKCFDLFQRQLRGLKPEIFEIEIRTKKGKLIPVEINGLAVKEGGKIIGVQVIARDITKRKEIEIVLKESEKKYKTIFEGATDGILAVDVKTKRFAFANPRMCEITGYSLKELLKLSVADIHPKKDLPHVIDQFTKQAQGKITLAKDIPVLRKDKKVVYCDINSKVIEIGKKEYLVGFFRDITERKKAEEALKESEKKWRSFLDNAPDIVIIVDRKGKIEYINYVQPGFSLEKVIGTNIYDYVPPEHHAKMRASISKVFRTGKPDSYEVVGPGPKGMTLYYLTAVGPIKENEQVVAVILFSRDITERKRVEEKLKFLKEFNERVVNSISDALLVIDPYNYTIISANEAALKQSKLRKKELVGKPCYEITHHRSKPCKPPHDICPIQEMLKTGKAITIEHTHFDKYNNEIYVEVSVSPVRNKEGKIIQVVHIAKDITERKKAEEALKESEEKFRKLFESANDGIIYLSRFGRILDVNEKTVQLFGGSKKELLGKDFTKVGIFSLRDIPKLMSNFSKVLAGKKTILNIQIKNKRGQEIPLECSSSLIKKDDKVVGMMVIMRDITERKKTEEELKKRTEELEKFSKFAVGRELRMIELKKEINELREKLRERSKYNVKIKKR